MLSGIFYEVLSVLFVCIKIKSCDVYKRRLCSVMSIFI